MRLGIVIPAHNEERAIGPVVSRCRRAAGALGSFRIMVVDNASSDGTTVEAQNAGATVISVIPRGYGRACQAAVWQLGDWPDVLIFLDADGSAQPEEIERLIEPIRANQADLVLGQRPQRAPLTLLQRFGNQLAAFMIRIRWGHCYQDLGPFRAIRRLSFQALKMTDPTWGWTVEMQILALLKGLRVYEVSVTWSQRLAGRSKISGNLKGALCAGAKILWTIGRYLTQSVPPAPTSCPVSKTP